jgi:Tol biopolymer transport system component
MKATTLSLRACGAVFIIVLALVASYTSAEPKFSDWSAAVNLGAVVNSAFADAGPALSKDGRSLYFFSGRPGLGGTDIWVSERESENEEWGVPQNIGPIVNSTAPELHPSLSRDGHWLFFTRGGLGARNIWVSYREHVHDNFDWQPPLPVGPGINTTADEMDASFFENDEVGGPQLFFARGEDIYVSSLLPDGTFGTGMPVREINGATSERGLSVRFDGLEAFFFSNRSGLGPNDLFATTRKTVLDSWSSPVNLGALVNSVGLDGEPEIASDRETLYFNSNRAGTYGGLDLYMTTRKKGPR